MTPRTMTPGMIRRYLDGLPSRIAVGSTESDELFALRVMRHRVACEAEFPGILRRFPMPDVYSRAHPAGVRRYRAARVRARLPVGGAVIHAG